MKPRRVALTPLLRAPASAVPITRSTPWGNPWTVTAQLHRDPYTGELTAGRFVYIVRNAETGHHERVEQTREGALRLAARLYEEQTLMTRLETRELELSPLRGKNLACRCPLSLPCHGDALLIYANHPDPLELAYSSRRSRAPSYVRGAEQ